MRGRTQDRWMDQHELSLPLSAYPVDLSKSRYCPIFQTGPLYFCFLVYYCAKRANKRCCIKKELATHPCLSMPVTVHVNKAGAEDERKKKKKKSQLSSCLHAMFVPDPPKRCVAYKLANERTNERASEGRRRISHNWPKSLDFRLAPNVCFNLTLVVCSQGEWAGQFFFCLLSPLLWTSG